MLSSKGTLLKQDLPVRHVRRQIIIKVLVITVLAFGLIAILPLLISYPVPLYPGATFVSTTFGTDGYVIERTYNIANDSFDAVDNFYAKWDPSYDNYYRPHACISEVRCDQFGRPGTKVSIRQELLIMLPNQDRPSPTGGPVVLTISQGKQ